MKNFLIEFFRPLDNLIFNYLVKIGAIKPIFSALIGAVASSALSRRGQKKAQQQSIQAEERSRGDLQRAFKKIRDPNAILREAYGSGGMFGTDIQNRILGAEERLLPGFLDLQKQQAQSQLLGEGGLMDIGQVSRLGELGFIGAFSPAARLLLEDPRLAAIADADLDAALNPLSGERARAVEQSALEDAVRMGRGRGQGAIAQLALGRSAATDAARLRALQSSQIARIDPTALLGGLSPRVDAMSGAFLSQAPGTLVTDPGQAINVGSARDVQRANVLIGQGALASQAGAARSQIAGQGYQALGSTLGGMDFSGIFGNKTPVSSGPIQTFGSVNPNAGFNPYQEFGIPR
jgi:hypothetical protein